MGVSPHNDISLIPHFPVSSPLQRWFRLPYTPPSRTFFKTSTISFLRLLDNGIHALARKGDSGEGSKVVFIFFQLTHHYHPPFSGPPDVVTIRTAMLPMGKSHYDDLLRLFSKPGPMSFATPF
ncbi:hypothetical protein PIB30_000336 [Stylosanthes scabra]|uniref:Uncharacterized protein n=1 Tax=Stylosanthes scabra TaxID=79078 RepID=A0ABU6T237_9FABA|nr:hypothetical protein [Stylosanthes scabra]